MIIRYRLLSPIAKVPTRAHPHDAGLDLYAVLEASRSLPPGGRLTVDTGIAMAIPEGYVGLVQPRSGLAKGHGVVAVTGVVDAGYHGEIRVTLVNHGDDVLWINHGHRVAQIVVVPIPVVELVEVDALPDTARGVAGFGSTGLE